MKPRQEPNERPMEDCVKLPAPPDIFSIFKKKNDGFCGVPDLKFPSEAIKKAAVDYVKEKVFGK